MYQSNSLPMRFFTSFRMTDRKIVTLIQFYIITLLKNLYFFNHHRIPLSDTDTKGTQGISFILFL